MKFRRLGLFVSLTLVPPILLAQRMARSEVKPPAGSASATHSEVAVEPSKPAEHRPRAEARGKAQAAKFQQVALALNLTVRQKESVRTLVQTTRQQLQAASTNTSLSAEQQQAATRAIRLAMVQKFVGLLTPEQKSELSAMLLKHKQQQNSKSNSSSAASGASPSMPDIPSVDAPSSTSDSADSQVSGSVSDLQSPPSAAPAPPGDSGAAADPATANSSTQTAATAQTASGTQVSSNSSSVPAKSAQLSDAQLAAILNSFVQDDAGQTGAKQSAQPGNGSTS